MIVRKVKKNNYSMISNEIFQNRNLSLKAKGLLALCLSLPDDWDFNKNGLATFSTDGRQSVETAIKELKENHYLLINTIQIEDGKFDSEWVIYEEPYTGKPHTEKPSTEKPMTVLPYTVNQHLQINNKQINKNKLIKTNNKKQRSNNNKAPTYEEIESYCKEKGIEIDIDYFIHYWTEKDWKRWDKNLKKYVLIKDLKGTIRTWAKNQKRYDEDRQISIGSKQAYIKDVELKTQKNNSTKANIDREMYNDLVIQAMKEQKK